MMILIVAAAAIALIGPAAPQLGDRATYTDTTGGRWCVTLTALEANGPGAVPYAWATVDADPRRLVHVPAAELARSCK